MRRRAGGTGVTTEVRLHVRACGGWLGAGACTAAWLSTAAALRTAGWPGVSRSRALIAAKDGHQTSTARLAGPSARACRCDKLLLLQVLLLACADTQLSDIDCGCTGQLADAEKVDTNVFDSLQDSLGASYSAADAASDAQLDLQQLLHVKHSRLHTAGAIDPARPTRSACVIWPLLRSRLRSLLLVVDILLIRYAK